MHPYRNFWTQVASVAHFEDRDSASVSHLKALTVLEIGKNQNRDKEIENTTGGERIKNY